MKKGKALFYIGLVLLILGLGLTIAGRTMQNSMNYDAGVTALNNGDYETAVELLKPLEKVDYKDSRVLLEQAESALSSEDKIQAEDAENK